MRGRSALAAAGRVSPNAVRDATAATILESALPFKELSEIAAAERRVKDPAYSVHRWWARRPPGVMRGLLLAATMSSDESITEFWHRFATDKNWLDGTHVHDLFAGGGSVLVEASRLGASVSGTDVDPLAVEIIRHELDRAEDSRFASAMNNLLKHLRKRAESFFPSAARGWIPLHYFYIHDVTCPGCKTTAPMFRDLIIARDAGLHGGVPRAADVVVFCPACWAVHNLTGLGRKEFRCCGRRHKIHSGNFSKGRYSCNECGVQSMHRDLKTGVARRRLIGVEETREGQRRRIRKPWRVDLDAVELAERYVARHQNSLYIPKFKLTQKRCDDRPVSFGVTNVAQLFTARQLIVFGKAFTRVRSQKLDVQVKRGLSLALSNALATNNRLCGYARDYGRLAPLFSIRGYSLPLLAVELNPFHPTGGRGTIERCLNRVRRSASDEESHRYVWNVEESKVQSIVAKLPPRTPDVAVLCASASEADLRKLPPFDICLFDPPYFDYIAYSELSEFYRGWLPRSTLGGVPLLPTGKDPAESFGKELGRALKNSSRRLRHGRPLIFTYHSSDERAWKAIGIALTRANLRVTALWPLRNDAHMGHHTAAGNCEWDVVVVCRRSSECVPQPLHASVRNWVKSVRPFFVSKADQRNMQHALDMASPRFARPLA